MQQWIHITILLGTKDFYKNPLNPDLRLLNDIEAFGNYLRVVTQLLNNTVICKVVVEGEKRRTRDNRNHQMRRRAVRPVYVGMLQ